MGTKPAAGNLQAKLILSMITLYVDGEGCCFVSIPALAEDCEMSPDTVRRRLAWLESIGVITRTAQWLAEGEIVPETASYVPASHLVAIMGAGRGSSANRGYKRPSARLMKVPSQR